MTTYVVFLRAINVGGRAVIKMTDLRDAFTAAGCKNVRTYIQSGNVVFDAAPEKVASHLQKVRGRLKSLLGHEPGVALRTLSELEGLVKSAPFKGIEEDSDAQLYVAFLGEKPKATLKFPMTWVKEALEAIGIRKLDVLIVSRPKPNGRYGYPNLLLESAILVPATTRNWTTVKKVVEFARKG